MINLAKDAAQIMPKGELKTKMENFWKDEGDGAKSARIIGDALLAGKDLIDQPDTERQ